MKNPLYSAILFLSIMLITSCSNRKKPLVYNKITDSIVDSFFVSGLEDLPEDFANFSMINDSICIALASRMRALCIFKESKQSRHFVLAQKEDDIKGIHSIISFMKAYNTGSRNWRLILGDYAIHHSLSVYDQKLNLNKTNNIDYKFPHLSDNYSLVAETPFHPAYITGDTLVTGLTINNASQFDNYYADDMFMRLLIKGDSISFINTFGKYAAGVRSFYPPIPSYAWGNNHVWIVYPGLDTIFSYNITTGTGEKIPIHNPDFVAPKKWTEPAHDDLNYFSKLSRYSNENFKYFGIIFDTHSRNLILWYQKPHKIKEQNGLLNTKGKGEWYIITMSLKGKILRNYKIDEHTYFSFIFQTPKGLAIPRYQNNLTHEKTIHFDIFSL